jgi:hypothetical protein
MLLNQVPPGLLAIADEAFNDKTSRFSSRFSAARLRGRLRRARSSVS